MPQVDTVEQARHIVSAAKFGAGRGGTRSAPPARFLAGGTTAGALDPSRSIWENLNDQAAIIIQIESERGVHNLDAILTAVGQHIDAVWLGMLDLRVSMGLEGMGMWGEEPEFQRTLRLYEETLHKHGKPAAGPCFDGNWTRGSNKSFVMVSGDDMALLGQRENILNARANLPPSDKRQTWRSTAE